MLLHVSQLIADDDRYVQFTASSVGTNGPYSFTFDSSTGQNANMTSVSLGHQAQYFYFVVRDGPGVGGLVIDNVVLVNRNAKCTS